MALKHGIELGGVSLALDVGVDLGAISLASDVDAKLGGESSVSDVDLDVESDQASARAPPKKFRGRQLFLGGAARRRNPAWRNSIRGPTTLPGTA